MASERLSEALEAEMKRLWGEWEHLALTPDLEQEWLKDQRAFARMVMERTQGQRMPDVCKCGSVNFQLRCDEELRCAECSTPICTTERRPEVAQE